MVFRTVILRSDRTHPSSLEDIRAHTFFYFMYVYVCVFCSVTIKKPLLFLSCIFLLFLLFLE